MRVSCRIWWLVALAAILPAFAAATDPIGVVTELQANGGRIEFRRGGAAWQAPRPLHAVYVGDEYRVLGPGRLVIVFAAEPGTVVLTKDNSPFIVANPEPPGLAKRLKSATAEFVRDILGRRAYAPGGVSYLHSQQRAPGAASLAIRGGGPKPLFIMGPRDTRVWRGDVTFDWSGPESRQYTVRLVGPAGFVWEGTGLERHPLRYAGAPALAPGSTYTWELRMSEQSVDSASFVIASEAEESAVRGILADVRADGYPAATAAAMQVAVLIQDGLYDAARRLLLEAIATSPKEPTLQVLLGAAYERIGLPDLATRAYEEAESLIDR